MRIFIHDTSLCFEPEVDSDITWLYATLEMFKNQNFYVSKHSITQKEAESANLSHLLDTPERKAVIEREYARGKR